MKFLQKIAAVAIPIIVAFVSTNALAEEHEDKACLERTLMVDSLIKEYGEQLAEVHEVKGKGLLEFHVSPKNGTWTALLTDENDVSCVLAVGDGIDPSAVSIIPTGTKI